MYVCRRSTSVSCRPQSSSNSARCCSVSLSSTLTSGCSWRWRLLRSWHRGSIDAVSELSVGLRLQCAHIFSKIGVAHIRAYSRILAAAPRISRISAAGGRTGRRALAGLDGTRPLCISLVRCFSVGCRDEHPPPRSPRNTHRHHQKKSPNPSYRAANRHIFCEVGSANGITRTESQIAHIRAYTKLFAHISRILRLSGAHIRAAAGA
jgi:hypothetical protein